MLIRPAALLVLACAVACVTPQEDVAKLDDFKQRASAYYETGNLHRAEQQARMGLALDPDHAMLNLLLGRTMLKWHDLKSVARSRPYLEKAYSVQQEFRTAYSLGEFHQRYAEFLIGEANLIAERAEQIALKEAAAAQEMRERSTSQLIKSREHLQDAEQLLEEALSDNPTSIYALRLMANCYVHQHMDDQALVVLGSLITELEDSRAWKNGRLSSDGSLDILEEEYLRKLVKEELQMEVDARGLASAIHKRASRFKEAEEMLTTVLNLSPSLEREYYNRGMCRYWQGNLAGAASDMREFIQRTSLAIDASEVARALDIVGENEAVKKATSN